MAVRLVSSIFVLPPSANEVIAVLVDVAGTATTVDMGKDVPSVSTTRPPSTLATV